VIGKFLSLRPSDFAAFRPIFVIGKFYISVCPIYEIGKFLSLRLSNFCAFRPIFEIGKFLSLRPSDFVAFRPIFEIGKFYISVRPIFVGKNGRT
jgi:hypothetical protein